MREERDEEERDEEERSEGRFFFVFSKRCGERETDMFLNTHQSNPT